ncbi:hypothetical protein DZS_49060 [Dickeya ananatis]
MKIPQVGRLTGIELGAGGSRQTNIILKQRQTLQPVTINRVVGQRDKDRIKLLVIQHGEQTLIRPHGQIEFQIGTAQFDAHDQARHRFQRQRIQCADTQSPLTDACGLAGFFQPSLHQRHRFLAVFQQRMCRWQCHQIATFMDKQRATHAFFQSMQRPVHADTAQPKAFRGTGNGAGFHEGLENLKFAEGDVAVC